MISVPRYFYTGFLSFVAALIIAQSASGLTPEVRASLSSNFLVVGEQAELRLEVFDLKLTSWPTPPKVSPLTLKQKRYYVPAIRGRSATVFIYTISCYKPGRFSIPPFAVSNGSSNLSSDSFEVHIFPKEELNVGAIKIGDSTFPYMSAILLEKSSLFVGESQSAVGKLYLPGNFNLSRQLPLIDLETKNIAAWRFAPDVEKGTYLREGKNYTVLSYPSAITPLSSGDVQLGPGTTQINLQWQEPRRGMTSWGKNQDFEFQFPKKNIKARPLPTPKPPGFGGGVGNFYLTSRALATKAQQNENITVEIKVRGTGNFDHFTGPTLLDEKKEWKQFEMVQKPQGSERRSSSGEVEFSQVVRPNEVVAGLPPYQFVFFDPLLERYRTIESSFQPISITAAPKSAILDSNSSASSYLPASNLPLLTFHKKSNFPIWIWQIIPAGIVIFFVTTWTRRELTRRKAVSLPAKEFEAALNQVAASSSNRITFYREAANFITFWKGRPDDEEFSAIQTTRDEICFSPNTIAEPVTAEEKKGVLESLRKLSPLVIFLFVFSFLSDPAWALSSDPKIAKTEILKEMEENPRREHFHNLALAEKSLGNQSEATLWAYRYAAQGGDTTELFKGLPGIRQREPKGSEWVSILPLAFYQQIFAAGFWGTILIFFFFKMDHTKTRKYLIILFSAFAPLLLILGALAWLMFPKDVSFRPIHEMSVVMKESLLQAQPYQGGQSGQSVESGSLGLVTSTSREWVHVEFPGKMKGWLLKEDVQPVIE